MAEQFKVGNTVCLKSGGPTMTVTIVGHPDETGTVWVTCSWFDEKLNQKTATLPADALQAD